MTEVKNLSDNTNTITEFQTKNEQSVNKWK